MKEVKEEGVINSYGYNRKNILKVALIFVKRHII